MSDSKMCRNVYPCQQIKNCLSSLSQTQSTTVFATTLFVTKIMCCCVTHDATSSILLNSTNEANTFLTMYNIIRFSRLSKLVSSNLNTGSKGSKHVKSLFWFFRFTVRCLSIFSLKYQIPGMKNKKAQPGVIFYFSHPLFKISSFISSKNSRFL